VATPLNAIRVLVVLFCSPQLFGSLVFLRQISREEPGMIEAFGILRLSLLILIPTILFLGGILFAFKKRECLYMFGFYLVYQTIHAAFAEVPIAVFSISLISMIMLYATKLSITHRFSKIDGFRIPGDFWTTPAVVSVRENAKIFILRQELGPWAIVHFGILNFYAFLILQGRAFFDTGEWLGGLSGLNDATLSTIFICFLLAGTLLLYFKHDLTKPVLFVALVAALYQAFQNPEWFNFVPAFWVSSILLFVYLKPFLEARRPVDAGGGSPEQVDEAQEQLPL
jgi:hypothetical protein